MTSPETISHYRVRERLGGGGMGVVYRAEDTTLKRNVALKFLPPSFSRDDNARERFILEAQAASALDHPNICTIHEIAKTDDDQLYIVMAYYSGETLKQKIARSPLGSDEAKAIAIQIAQGLAEAHDHGIVHRDINPSNIFVTNDGVVKILDFGIAELTEEAKRFVPGKIMGTLAYMSPEQLMGETVDTRTDIWSFGVLVFEMLTQRSPFVGTHSAEMIYAINNEQPLDISRYCDELTDELRTLYERCLEKESSERVQSMDEVLALLGAKREQRFLGSRFLGSQPVIVRWSALTIVAALAATATWLLIPRDPLPVIEKAKPSLAVLKFAAVADMPEVATMRTMLQTLFATLLTGVEGLAVLDPVMLNGLVERNATNPSAAATYGLLDSAHASYALDGKIVKTKDRYAITLNLVRPESREILFNSSFVVRSERELETVCDSISLDILDFLQAASILPRQEEYRRVWWPKRFANVASLKAFGIACQYAYAGEQKSSEKYLRRAIKLDSLFLTPKVWLIPRLVERGDSVEAAMLSASAASYKAHASPFESTIIEWADACVKKDLRRQEQSLTAALNYSSANTVLMYSLGRVRYMLNDFAGCIEALKPAIAMRWEYPYLYYLLGTSHDALKNFSEAKKMFEEFLRLKGDHPPVFIHLGALCLRGRDITCANRYDSLFVATMHRRAVARRAIYEQLVEGYFSEGLYERGAEYYRLAIVGTNESANKHLEKAKSHWTREEGRLAVQELFRTLAIDSTNAEANLLLAQIFDEHFSEGEPTKEKAIMFYKKYLAFDSTSAASTLAKDRVQQLQQITTTK